MKKVSKILIIISILSMSMLTFAGCQSSSSSSSSTASSGQGKKFDRSAMQQKMKTNLETLVKAGTITEDQSSKILTALTAKPQGSQGNSGQGNNTNASSNGSGRRFGSSNALNDLVKQGVITQAQADAVKKSVMGNRQNHNNGNNSNGSSQSNQ